MIPAPFPTADGYAVPLYICRMLVHPSEILLLRGDGNYTHIHLTEGRMLLASRNIGYYETLLPPNHFWRPHKTAIVNRSFIATIYKREVVLRDGTRLEVARRRWKEMKTKSINRHKLLFEL